MGIFDKLKGEFIDIIEWLDDSRDTIIHRFERYNNEIKFGAKLVVRESQTAVFINMGELADVFSPGTYELETKNLPLLSTLQGWKYGFNSPFKAEVYFVNTRRFTDLKWGTPSPVMFRDAEFGPIRLRARGSYSIRVNDPGKLIKEIAGTDAHFTTNEVIGQLRNIIVSRFMDVLGEGKIPALDLSASYDELGSMMVDKLTAEFGEYGLEVLKILIENIALPDSVNEVLDKRTGMGIAGNLNQYTQFQAANAMEAAANNPSGTASGGIGMGMGFAMAENMSRSMSQPQTSAPQAPPPLPVAFYVAVAGQQTGPFDLSVLQQKTESGELKRETLVWKSGMSAWTKAGEVSELSSLFGQVPPPLPPQ